MKTSLNQCRNLSNIEFEGGGTACIAGFSPGRAVAHLVTVIERRSRYDVSLELLIEPSGCPDFSPPTHREG